MFTKTLALKNFMPFILSLLILFFAGFAIWQYKKLQETRQSALEILVRMLKVQKIYDEKGEIQLMRIGSPNDGGYVVAKKSLDMADVCLGYGIADDISFEEYFSDT